MKTPYDLISCIIFAGVAVLFLQRSAAAIRDTVGLWRYVVAALGCAIGDYLGNSGYALAGALCLCATTAFSLLALRLFSRGLKGLG